MEFFSVCLHPLTCDLVQVVSMMATIHPILPSIGIMFPYDRPLVPHRPPQYAPFSFQGQYLPRSLFILAIEDIFGI